jgi:hypothetical protein
MAKGNGKRAELLASIASTIADYRYGAIEVPDADHVETWVSQFDDDAQTPILVEMDHVLKKTYLPKKAVKQFLKQLAANEQLATDDPCGFWRDIAFLDIQGGGNSQRDMLAMFDKVLQKQCGFGVADCGATHAAFLYLDDAIFTGNRVLNDIRSWLQGAAPKKSKLHVVTVAYHRGGQWYTSQEIEKAANGVGKSVDISWWRCLEIEDRKSKIDVSDVLRPASLPADTLMTAYVQALRYPPVLRTPDNVGENGFFSSEAGRHLLEQEFLKAGLHIRSICPNLNKYQRPLGNMVLDTLGFGSLFVTFRNCPNNCPLALWAGDPWYPLFLRKTN